MNQGDTSYCCAVWDWLEGRSQKPIPKDFGLDDAIADVLYRQCYRQYSAKCRAAKQDQSNVMRPQSSELGPWSEKP